MVAQTAQEAIDNANRYTTCEPGMCLKYVRTWLGIPSREADAQSAWDTAIGKHPGDKHPPDAAPVFWKSSPSGSGHGHIALTRKSDMRTTDKASSGHVGNDDGSWPRAQWGQSYLGWAEGFNGVRIPYLGTEWLASGDVYVSKLHKGQQDSDSVARLRYRLMHHPDMPDKHKPTNGDDYGGDTQGAVRYWQEHLNGGGEAGDPAPGPTDGTSLSNAQANRLFGGQYTVIEK